MLHLVNDMMGNRIYGGAGFPPIVQNNVSKAIQALKEWRSLRDHSNGVQCYGKSLIRSLSSVQESGCVNRTRGVTSRVRTQSGAPFVCLPPAGTCSYAKFYESPRTDRSLIDRSNFKDDLDAVSLRSIKPSIIIIIISPPAGTDWKTEFWRDPRSQAESHWDWHKANLTVFRSDLSAGHLSPC